MVATVAFPSYRQTRDGGYQVNPNGLAYFRLFYNEILDLLFRDRNKLVGYIMAFSSMLGPNTEKFAERLRVASSLNCFKMVSQMLHTLLITEEGTLLVDSWLENVSPELHAAAHGTGIDPQAPWVQVFVKFFMREDDPKFLMRIVASFHVLAIIDKIEAKPRSYDGFLSEYRKAINYGQIRRLAVLKGLEMKLDERLYGQEFDHRFYARLFIRTLPMCNKDEGDRDDWVFELVTYLKKDARNRAMLTIFMPNYSQELEVRRQMQIQAATKDFVEEVAEDGLEATECTPQAEAKSQMYDTWVLDNAGAPYGTDTALRSYQHELAEHACQGKNAVIVAPTGAGKTYVAAHIARSHFDSAEREGRAARVVFVVPKVPLVEQQCNAFKQFFHGRYLVVGLHGAATIGDEDDRRKLLLGAHLIVITPQLLINMLKSVRRAERIYLCDLTMVMLDECHHTTKESAYNVLMDMVHQYKHTKPQIVGLTASLGTGGMTNNPENVCEYIYRLCGAMNCQRLSTVQKYKDELNKYVQLPDDEVKRCSRDRQAQSFYYRLRVRMQDFEHRAITTLKSLSSGSGAIFNDREIAIGSAFKCLTRYEGMVSQLLERVKNQSNLKAHVRMDLLAGLQLLKLCANAMLIDEVMPSCYALDYLKRATGEQNENRHLFFDEFWSNGNDQALRAACEQERLEQKEIVRELESRIREQLARLPGSRILIFVKERSAAQLLSMAINEHAFFRTLRNNVRGKIAGFATGAGSKKKGQQASQTVQEQARTMEDFKDGKLKVMVATSVMEEGVDVQACNLIIKYNMTGTTISEVQKRGRARATGSKSVLLVVSDSVEQREMENRQGEMMMAQALKIITQLNEAEFMARCDKSKRERQSEKDRQAADEKRMLSNNKNCTLQCINCEGDIGRSTHMRTIMNHNYVVCSDRIWERIIFEPKKKIKSIGETALVLGSALCGRIANEGESDAACKAVLGTVIKYADTYHVQLSLNSLKIIDDATEECVENMTKKKWGSIKTQLFYIPEITEGDLKRMLHSVPDRLTREFLAAEAQIKEEAMNQIERKRRRRIKDQEPLNEWYADDDDFEDEA